MHAKEDRTAPENPTTSEISTEATPSGTLYVVPRLEVLNIEATRNNPGAFPDAGIDFS